MEQMMLSHLIHADEALTGANAMCDVDPLLINERGVLHFYNKECTPYFLKPTSELTNGQIRSFDRAFQTSDRTSKGYPDFSNLLGQHFRQPRYGLQTGQVGLRILLVLVLHSRAAVLKKPATPTKKLSRSTLETSPP
jgi:hypothetical protein